MDDASVGNAVVDCKMVDAVVEDGVAVDNPVAATARRRRCLCRHTQGGEMEARGKVRSMKQESNR